MSRIRFVMPVAVSKITDAVVSRIANDLRNGVIAYHGSRHRFTEFDPNKPVATPYLWDDNKLGIFFAASEPIAKQFGRYVYVATITAKNPRVFEWTEYIDAIEAARGGAALQRQLRQMGYDCAVRLHPNTVIPAHYVVFDVSQIKLDRVEGADESRRMIDAVLAVSEAWLISAN